MICAICSAKYDNAFKVKLNWELVSEARFKLIDTEKSVSVNI
jgi:hypothetical protein